MTPAVFLAACIALLATGSEAQQFPFFATSTLSASNTVPASTSTATGSCAIVIGPQGFAGNTVAKPVTDPRGAAFVLQVSSTAGLGQIHIHAGSTSQADNNQFTPRLAILGDFTNGQLSTTTVNFWNTAQSAFVSSIQSMFGIQLPASANPDFGTIARLSQQGLLYCDVHFANTTVPTASGRSAIRGNLNAIPYGQIPFVNSQEQAVIG